MTLIEQLQQTGIHRVGSPKTDLQWVGASKRDLARLEELKIPPAWTDVAVSRSPSSKLQAIGRDKKGRWQYRYSDEVVLERERRKYEKLVAFGKALPRLRKEIDRRLALRGLPPREGDGLRPPHPLHLLHAAGQLRTPRMRKLARAFTLH